MSDNLNQVVDPIDEFPELAEEVEEAYEDIEDFGEEENGLETPQKETQTELPPLPSSEEK